MSLLALLAGATTSPPVEPPTYVRRQIVSNSGLMTAPFTTLTDRLSGTWRMRVITEGTADSLVITTANLGTSGYATGTFVQALAIETADGAIIPATYSGSARVTLAGGVTVHTDPITLPARVPAGTSLWVRTYREVASAGVQWPGTDYVQTQAARGEGTNYYSSDPSYRGLDWTVTGSPAWPAGLLADQPTFIHHTVTALTTDTQAAWGGIGDSVLAASGDTEPATGVRGWFGRILTRDNLAGVKLAQGGRAMSTLNGAGYRSAWFEDGGTFDALTDLVVAMGRNDISTGASFPTTLAAQFLTFGTWLRDTVGFGGHVLAATITPYTTSTDAWATTGNQTLHHSPEGVRTLWNDWLRDGAPILGGVAAPGTTDPAALRMGETGHPFTGCLDVTASVETSTNSGIWKAAHTSDGLHPNATGHAAIAAALTLPATL